MKILALDMASTVGFAVDGAKIVPPLTGTYRLYSGGQALGTAFYLFQGWLYDMIEQHEVELLAFEAPIMTRTDNTTLIQLLFGLSTCAMAMAGAHRIRYQPADIQKTRRHFIGNGRAPEPKPAVMARCHQLGWTPHNYDESDACAVWDWAKANFDRKNYDNATSTPPLKKIEDAARTVA